jgi:hypothetical protein
VLRQAGGLEQRDPLSQRPSAGTWPWE